jgi:hypothetical protein
LLCTHAATFLLQILSLLSLSLAIALSHSRACALSLSMSLSPPFPLCTRGHAFALCLSFPLSFSLSAPPQCACDPAQRCVWRQNGACRLSPCHAHAAHHVLAAMVGCGGQSLSEVISLSHTHTHTGNDVQTQGDTTKERETDLTCQPVQTDRHSLNTLYGTTRKS